ncbi:MAG: RelA/SpoT domain-containing protein [Pirellulales bacterium]
MALIQPMPLVHSIRWRIKDATHLQAKIIRKRLDNPDWSCNLDNYLEQITDLIGIRAIHLFKQDWKSIHQEIMELFWVKESPEGYFREGDSPDVVAEFQENNITPKKHPFGYRSIHYLLDTQISRKYRFIAELQVRTILKKVGAR